MESIRLKARAKINLGRDVIGRREKSLFIPNNAHAASLEPPAITAATGMNL